MCSVGLVLGMDGFRNYVFYCSYEKQHSTVKGLLAMSVHRSCQHNALFRIYTNDFTPKERTWIQPCHCTSGSGAFPSSANLFQTLGKHRHCWHSVCKNRPLSEVTASWFSFFSQTHNNSAASGKSSLSIANTAFDAHVSQSSAPSSSSLFLSFDSAVYAVGYHSSCSFITGNEPVSTEATAQHDQLYSGDFETLKVSIKGCTHRPENMHGKHQNQCHLSWTIFSWFSVVSLKLGMSVLLLKYFSRFLGCSGSFAENISILILLKL